MVFSGLKRFFGGDKEREVKEARDFLEVEKTKGTLAFAAQELLDKLNSKADLSPEEERQILDEINSLEHVAYDSIEEINQAIEVWKKMHVLIANNDKKFTPLAEAIADLKKHERQFKRTAEERFLENRNATAGALFWGVINPQTKDQLLQLYGKGKRKEFNRLAVEALRPYQERVTNEGVSKILIPGAQINLDITAVLPKAPEILWSVLASEKENYEKQPSLEAEFTQQTGLIFDKANKSLSSGQDLFSLVPAGVSPYLVRVSFRPSTNGAQDRVALRVEYPSPNFGVVQWAGQNRLEIVSPAVSANNTRSFIVLRENEHNVADDVFSDSKKLVDYLNWYLAQLSVELTGGPAKTIKDLPWVKDFQEPEKKIILEDNSVLDFKKEVPGFSLRSVEVTRPSADRLIVRSVYFDTQNFNVSAQFLISIDAKGAIAEVELQPRIGYESDVDYSTRQTINKPNPTDLPKIFENFIVQVSTAPKTKAELQPPPLPSAPESGSTPALPPTPEAVPQPAWAQLKEIKKIDVSVGLFTFVSNGQEQDLNLGGVPENFVLQSDIQHDEPNHALIINYAQSGDLHAPAAQLKFIYNDQHVISKIEAHYPTAHHTSGIISSKTPAPLNELGNIFAKFEFALEQSVPASKNDHEAEHDKRPPSLAFDKHTGIFTYKEMQARLQIPYFVPEKMELTKDGCAKITFKSSRPEHADRAERVQAILKSNDEGFVQGIELYKVIPAKDSHHPEEKIFIGESADRTIKTVDLLQKMFLVTASKVQEWTVYPPVHHDHDEHGEHGEHGEHDKSGDHGKHEKHGAHDKHAEAKPGKSAGHGHGHGHGHDAPPAKDPSPPKSDRWVEIKDKQNPIIDLDSSLLHDLAQSNPIFKEAVAAIFARTLEKKPVDELAFRSLFDSVVITQGPDSPEAKFIANLQKQNLTLENFKKMWRENLYTKVLATMTKASTAEQQSLREFGGTWSQKMSENFSEYQGYKTRLITKAVLTATGAAVGYGVSEYVDLDKLAVEAEGGAVTGTAALFTRWLGSEWRDAAKKIKAFGDKGIESGRKVKKEKQTARVRDQFKNDSEFNNYLQQKMMQWLAQSVREETLKKTATDNENSAHLHGEDDPNLYLFRIEAAKALETEYEADGDLKKKRLAQLDKYVNTLNLDRYVAGATYKERIVKKYQDGSKDHKEKWSAAVAKVDSGFLWAQSKSDDLRHKGSWQSLVLGVAAGVGLWGVSLPYKRALLIAAGTRLGYELGEHLDAQSATKKIDRETKKIQRQVETILQAFTAGKINELLDCTVSLQSALTLGVLSDSLKLQVQDTLHKIRMGEFFENEASARKFKMDLLSKSTDTAGATAQNELKRLGETTMNIRKYLGAIGGGLSAFVLGKVIGKE